MDPDVARTRVRMEGEDAYLRGSLTAARNIEGTKVAKGTNKL